LPKLRPFAYKSVFAAQVAEAGLKAEEGIVVACGVAVARPPPEKRIIVSGEVVHSGIVSEERIAVPTSLTNRIAVGPAKA